MVLLGQFLLFFDVLRLLEEFALDPPDLQRTVLEAAGQLRRVKRVPLHVRDTDGIPNGVDDAVRNFARVVQLQGNDYSGAQQLRNLRRKWQRLRHWT